MTFNELNLAPNLLRAVDEAGYTTPSPIQQKAIPPVLQGHDLLGCAQTGTGKTAAFALPMLQRLSNKKVSHKKVRALILTPTRELALQIDESFAQYGKYLKLSHAVIFGGVGQAPQVAALKRGVDVLTACPGRLNDLIGQGHVSLDEVEIFVLDEADRMLDMGFVHDVKKVQAKLPKQRQTLFFSATMPREIEQLADSMLQSPVMVKVDPVSSTVERIDQSLYFVSKADKPKLLCHLLKNKEIKNALVFSRTKHGADKIVRLLAKQGIQAAAIHGNKGQNARIAALEQFKQGKIKALIATDIAARGIDINELSHVFNYDLPEVPETYVHRIGRTARAGQDGVAIAFCSVEEREYLAGIEKLNRKKIPVVGSHPWVDGADAPKAPAAPVPRGKQPAKGAASAPAKKEKQAQPKAPRKEEPTVEQNNAPAQAGEGLSASAKRRRRRRRAQTKPEGAPAANAQAQPQQPKAQAKPQQKQAPKQGEAPRAPRQETRQPQRQEQRAPQRQEPRREVAPQQKGRNRTAPKQSDDPGLLLISRKPPVQKFASFEEYMRQHTEGAGAPVPAEDE